MTISVAIATYNRAAMVREAVKAALAQSRAPDEVVVADDASTDATAETLEPLARVDQRVRLLRAKRNSGGVENWNAAIRATRGDLIAWCSDDDRFLPGHLEAAHAYLEGHPEVGLVHAGFVDVLEFAGSGPRSERRPLRAPSPLIVSHRNLFRYLIRFYDWPFHPSTIVMRREVWERVGPFDSAYVLADTDWFVRAAEQYPVALLPRHGVLNRRHAGNWSSRVGSARMQMEIFTIIKCAMRRRWPGPSLTGVLWRAVWRANVCLRLGLTMRARIRDGHAEAAGVAWQTLARLAGVPWLAAAGEHAIRFWVRRDPDDGARQSLSPL